MSRARRIGYCIYCRMAQGPLSKEHVIPFGLIPVGYRESWVLQGASCRKCHAITSAFEGHVLGQVFRTSRAALGLRTRHGKVVTGTLIVERGGTLEEVRIPIKDYPATIFFPKFPPPAYLDGREYASGIEVNGNWIIQVAGPPLKSVAQRYETKKLQFRATLKGHSYPRLIAKVAYGVAVADFGLEGIENAYVLPAILGESSDIGRWVGCDGLTMIKNRQHLHTVSRSVVNGEIIARVCLFAKFGAPEYVVVVGRIAKGAQPGKFSLPR